MTTRASTILAGLLPVLGLTACSADAPGACGIGTPASFCTPSAGAVPKQGPRRRSDCLRPDFQSLLDFGSLIAHAPSPAERGVVGVVTSPGRAA